ncbi:Lrp/AsnC family transcriptional regulator [Qingshengfaniella alkalisoli]|uniref:Lrp/AsnC family transcriptional regulator n=1 Tax=Qingshengfaniella alkalisoli TaxID=2599296 RepID=A0A5B8J246_9RHOB|nr:Lrp/AsnC family transcriptional regulator [Qingshengfaniella alkalisoli]QDY71231.1 Lrp/AsnC family transcriptional regulator [Qingshengfaniella alkalisoli]
MQLDRSDIRLLGFLADDGRMTIAELAERVGMSPTACRRRVSLLEEAGVISGYRAVIDRTKAGFPVTIFVSIRLDHKDNAVFGAFKEKLKTFPEVVAAYTTSGNEDFLLIVNVADVAGFENFLQHRLMNESHIASLRSQFAINRFIYRQRLPEN